MTDASRPNSSGPSTCARMGDTTTPATICSDQTTTYSRPRPNSCELPPREPDFLGGSLTMGRSEIASGTGANVVTSGVGTARLGAATARHTGPTTLVHARIGALQGPRGSRSVHGQAWLGPYAV